MDTMRVSLLLLLSLLVARGAGMQCIKAFKPTVVSIEGVQGPLDPRQADRHCNTTHPGYGVLKRAYKTMKPGAGTQCATGRVPLGVLCTLVDEQPKLVWHLDTWFRRHRDVNSTYLEDADDVNCSEPRVGFIGSLDLRTRRWTLSNDSQVDCALCQRAWRDNLRKPADHATPTPTLNGAFELRLYGDANTSVAVQVFAALFGDDAKSLRANATVQRFDGNITTFRVTARNVDAGAEVCSTTPAKEMGVVECRDLHQCSAGMAEGIDWWAASVGKTRSVSLTGYLSASRECLARPLGPAVTHVAQVTDWDAVWGNVTLWHDLEAPCRSNETRDLGESVEEYASYPDDVTLEGVLNRTATFAELDPSLVNKEDAENRAAIFRGVARLLEVLLTTASSTPTVECHRLACVALRRGGNDTVVVSVDAVNDTLNARVDVDTTASWNFQVRVPTSLTQRFERVAVSVMHNASKNYHLYQARANSSAFRYTAAAILQVVLTEQRSQNGVSPAFVEVRTRRTQPDQQLWFRLGGVWQLDGADDSRSRPCLAVAAVSTGDNVFRCYAPQDGNNTSNWTAELIAYQGWSVPFLDKVELGKVETIVQRYRDVHSDNASLAMVIEVVGLLGVHEKAVHETDALMEDVEALATDFDLGDAGYLLLDKSLHAKALISNLSVVGVAQNRLTCSSPLTPLTSRRSERIGTPAAVDYVVDRSHSDLATLYDRLVLLLSLNATRLPKAHGLVFSDVRVVLVPKRPVTNPDDLYLDDLYLDIQVSDAPDLALHADGAPLGDDHGVKAAVVPHAANLTLPPEPRDCSKLRSTRGQKHVFRCQGFQLVNGTLRLRALLYEGQTFADWLDSRHPFLKGVMVVEAVLAVGSLLVIAVTAFTLKAWRRDLGHRVLLQVTLALSMNLALSLATTFKALDSASNGCVVVGVLRHFSYLAMFMWMLAQSLLQLRRLTSPVGARQPAFCVPFLLAWGLPLSTVALLLMFDSSLYRSDKEDRGFCYPEGVAFNVTVQGPAALILVFNLGVFLEIVRRMRGVWQPPDSTPAPINKGLAHFKRLVATSLNWLAWTFHFLAEQGIWGSGEHSYMFNYLFLLTASLHLASLAAFFVFFDADTRKDWRLAVPILRRHAAVNANELALRLRGK